MSTLFTRSAMAFLLLSFSYSTIFAQQKETFLTKTYFELGAGGGSHQTGFSKYAVQAVFKKNWSASISYHSMLMTTNNLPSDYQPSHSEFLGYTSTGYPPGQNMNALSFTAGKLFRTSRSFWLNTEAGVSMVTGDKFTFTSQPVVQDNNVFLGSATTSNYKTEIKSEQVMGLMLKADFTWAFCPVAGIGGGMFANFNSINSPIGAEVKLVIGWMHRGPRE